MVENVHCVNPFGKVPHQYLEKNALITHHINSSYAMYTVPLQV